MKLAIANSTRPHAGRRLLAIKRTRDNHLSTIRMLEAVHKTPTSDLTRIVAFESMRHFEGERSRRDEEIDVHPAWQRERSWVPKAAVCFVRSHHVESWFSADRLQSAATIDPALVEHRRPEEWACFGGHQQSFGIFFHGYPQVDIEWVDVAVDFTRSRPQTIEFADRHKEFVLGVGLIASQSWTVGVTVCARACHADDDAPHCE